MTRTQAVASAIGLFAVWTLATYLLEARLGTFLRPDVTSRFVYALVANVLIGTIGAALIIRALVHRVEQQQLLLNVGCLVAHCKHRYDVRPLRSVNDVLQRVIRGVPVGIGLPPRMASRPERPFNSAIPLLAG